MVLIRSAQPTDANALSAIALAAKASWGYAPEQIELWRDDLTISAQSIESRPTYCAVANRKILGFYQISQTEACSRLEHLWIAPLHMSRGIGSALLSDARNRSMTDLIIDSDPHAESFYLKQGATRVGSIDAPIPGNPFRILPVVKLHKTTI